MRAQEFIFERETVSFHGIDMSVEREEDEILVRASAGGRTLGSVLFVDYDGELMPQDLEVDERYRGQGIAAAMYDYVKSQGYRIRRSGQQTDAGAGFWDKHRPSQNIWEQDLSEINSPGQLGIDNDLIDRFTDRGWEIVGEGQDQMVFGKPDSRMLLKVVGFGSLPRQAAIRKYITFFRAHQRNPHFPRVGVDRTLKWKGRQYYAYTQERLAHLPGDEDVLMYLSDVISRVARDESPDYDKIPAGLTEEQVDGLVMAIETMFRAGLGIGGFDLANIYNLMQREDGQLVIVDPYSSWDDEEITEVKILSKVKGKGSEPSQLPRYGRPIGPGEETRYLGKQVGRLANYEIWQDWIGGQLSYHLFDPQDRRVVLTSFGSQYKGNPRSYIIHGLYAAPGNPVKAHQFYRALIKDLGMTLVSDRKQSPGGNRVWQRLEAYPDIEVYGYDTRTGEVKNFGARDSEMYAVGSQAAKGSQEMAGVARDLRLVATAR